MLQGHVMDRLRDLPDESVHCICTSPPYYGLRDYGLEPVIWEPVRYAPMTGVPEMTQPAWRGCLGLEPNPALYIGHLVQVFREAKRVLRADGTFWLNLGDSYASGNRKTRDADKKLDARGMDMRPADPLGIKPKDLMGIPWRVALALQADGWWLRSDIVWEKSNAMPESVMDRPTRSHEMIFLFSKSQKYFYDHIAVMEPANSQQSAQAGSFRRSASKRAQCIPGQSAGTHRPDRPATVFANDVRNRRDVWTVPTQPFKGAHFAVFPPDLVDPMIRAGTSEKGVCPICGTPWIRVIEREHGDAPASYNGSSFHTGKTRVAREPLANVGAGPRTTLLHTAGWQPGCHCDTAGLGCEAVPAVVLDPFGGSGTVAIAAEALGRDWRLIEANPEYAAMAEARIREAREKKAVSKKRRTAGIARGDKESSPRQAQPQLEFFA